jgi:3-deoxy-D-manno-octulosonate 8-phosphate phosphatase KdsC-like HAD superfamily phosphatase
MKELSKIKIRFKIYDIHIITIAKKKLYCYMLTIYVEYVDGRFYLENDNSIKTYITKDCNFKITSSSNNKLGLITEKYFYIPSKENLGLGIKYCFFEDNKRKEFLKKFYNYLIEWGNNCEIFYNVDHDSEICINDDVWELKSTILPF